MKTIDRTWSYGEGDLATAKLIEVGELRSLRVAVDGVPVRIKVGGPTVVATAADGSLIPPSTVFPFVTRIGQTHLSIIEVRTSASASVDLMGGSC